MNNVYHDTPQVCRDFYTTSDLDLASFLKVRGHRFLGAKPLSPPNRLVQFHFDPTAVADVQSYFDGTQVSALKLFEAHRSLKASMSQAKRMVEGEVTRG
jgi:hypothetical protein